MKKEQCPKCKYYFTLKGGNYKKHINKCDGNYEPPKRKNNCKYCNKFLNNLTTSEIANHTRWCNRNPNRDNWNKNISTSSMNTKEAREKASLGISKAWKNGKYNHIDFSRHNLGKKLTEEHKEKISEKARNSDHRRLKRKDIVYNGVNLDSTWELELAKRLDKLGVKWERPKALKWLDDDGLYHNYFADFYLPEYDIYLDPKNPYAQKNQEYKINILTKQYKNIIIIGSLDECKNFDPRNASQ